MSAVVGSAIFPRNEAGTELVGFGVPGISGGGSGVAGRGRRGRISLGSSTFLRPKNIFGLYQGGALM